MPKLPEPESIIPATIPKATTAPLVPMRPQPHGGALKSGGVHANSGRPPAKLRGRAGRLYDDVMAEFENAMTAHRNGSALLTVPELAIISKETRPVSVADLKSVQLDGTAQSDAIIDELSDFWQDNELDPALLLSLVDRVTSRLADQ